MLEAIILDERDNVATAVADLRSGQEIMARIADKQGCITPLCDVALGHKFALSDIPQGEPVIKYGYIIGIAKIPIEKGQHVHVHNVESLRGRGDKQ